MPSKKLVVLTGAGVSAESGLSTFRDAGGLWDGHDVNEVASIDGWNNDPAQVLEFYNLRRKQASEAVPNAAHRALVDLESKFEVVIITQNVDDLHERAGSSKVIHLHGQLNQARSENNPEAIVDIGNKPIKLGDLAEDGSQLRPAIVWFGELVPMMEVAVKEFTDAYLLLVVGTSLAVYPAASLIHYCRPDTQKFMVDPIIPRIDDIEEWWCIEQTACEGVPPLVNEFLNLEKL